ncbi:MAG: MFS transporter [Promethearchaeota archaeon]|nr:MAG: MFS transporter [Candidatus Lokiarchaeota archaeon]
MNHKMKNNIWKIAVSDVFYHFGLIGSLYIIYFNYLGYDSLYIGIYEAITSLVIVASDLITGVIADKIGRKYSVLLSNTSFLIMAVLLASKSLFSGGFYGVLIFCGILNGLEFSFRSGARSALLYDTLIQIQREEEYLKISGRISAYSTISNVTGMLMGSFLYVAYPNLPYWVWAFFILLASLILITVQEPMQHNKDTISFWDNMKLGVKYIFRLKNLLWLVVFALFVDVFAEGYWDTFSQTHLENFVGEFYTMLIFACIGGVSAVVSYFIDKIEKSIGKKWILYMVVGGQTILFIALALAAQWYVLTTVLVFFNINRNITWLLTDNYQNKLIPSEHRASILSASSFLRNGLFGGLVMLILLGWAFKQFETNVTIIFFIIAGLVLLTNGSLLIIRDLREKRGKIPDLAE